MKVFSSALAIVAVATSFASAEVLRGENNNKNNQVDGRKLVVPPGGVNKPSSSVTEVPLNPGDTFAPFTPPEAETGLVCTALPDTGITEEYVVLQYNNTLPNGTKISDLDFTNRTFTFQLDVSWVYAWSVAKGECEQAGALREVYDAELLAYNLTDATFLLRLGSFSNSAMDYPFVDLPTSDNCGVPIYNRTIGNVPVDFDVDVAGRKLQTGPEKCDCYAPFAVQVVEQFNKAIVVALDDEAFANWTVATQQLCKIPGCVPPKNVVALYGDLGWYDDLGKKGFGVCVNDMDPLSALPSSTPSLYPTTTNYPTDTDVPTGTDLPTDTDVPTGTEPPTGTDAPSPAPSTAVPSSTPNPSPAPSTAKPTNTADPKKTPSPTITADPKTTPSPTKDATNAPTKDPDTPTVEPVDPTSAPVDDPTSAPVADPTEAPVADPTEAPVADPTEAPVAEPTGTNAPGRRKRLVKNIDRRQLNTKMTDTQDMIII